MTELRIRIDRSKRLADQPEVGHNRWHPDIAPIARIHPGERIVLETRDAIDGQVTAATRAADVPKLNLNVAHALTGPIAVVGAEPGDLLEVHIVEVESDHTVYGEESKFGGGKVIRDGMGQSPEATRASGAPDLKTWPRPWRWDKVSGLGLLFEPTWAVTRSPARSAITSGRAPTALTSG